MGGLRRSMPRHLLHDARRARVAISGLPPFSGFFSKDEILAGAYVAGQARDLRARCSVGPALTAFYMWRLVLLDLLRRARASTTTWRTTCTSRPRS